MHPHSTSIAFWALLCIRRSVNASRPILSDNRHVFGEGLLIRDQLLLVLTEGVQRLPFNSTDSRSTDGKLDDRSGGN